MNGENQEFCTSAAMKTLVTQVLITFKVCNVWLQNYDDTDDTDDADDADGDLKKALHG